MCEFADKYKNIANENEEKILSQMARELLLAQSSDWAFLMTTATATEYSTERTKEHIYNFWHLAKMVDEHSFDEAFYSLVEEKNSIFEFLNFRSYCTK
jgi:1,4-alpha-glucan branching enzyme